MEEIRLETDQQRINDIAGSGRDEKDGMRWDSLQQTLLLGDHHHLPSKRITTNQPRRRRSTTYDVWYETGGWNQQRIWAAAAASLVAQSCEL